MAEGGKKFRASLSTSFRSTDDSDPETDATEILSDEENHPRTQNVSIKRTVIFDPPGESPPLLYSTTSNGAKIPLSTSTLTPTNSSGRRAASTADGAKIVSLSRSMKPSALALASTDDAKISSPSESKLKDPLDWNLTEVQLWVAEHYNDKVAGNFMKQEVDGGTLLSDEILTDESLTLLGLNTIGKKAKFKSAVLQLREKAEITKENVNGQNFNGQGDRLLTHAEKKKLTCEDKRIYNTKKKMIMMEINKEWPEGEEIPSFRVHCTEEIKILDEFAKRIGSKDAFTFTKCCLGINTIKEMVKNTMRERRRSCKNKRLYSSSDLDASSTDTNSSYDSPPLAKKAKYDKYFHPDMTQDSCNVIVMVCINTNSIKDIQMTKHLIPLKKKFGLSLLRGQDKGTYVRSIANSLVENSYVEIEERADMAKLRREDVQCVKELVF